MTFILKQTEIADETHGKTLIVEQYQDKFCPVAFWRIIERNDKTGFAYILKDGLMNKPRKTQIEKYL